MTDWTPVVVAMIVGVQTIVVAWLTHRQTQTIRHETRENRNEIRRVGASVDGQMDRLLDDARISGDRQGRIDLASEQERDRNG